MVDITQALRMKKRNERYRRMQSALAAIQAELDKSQPDIVRLRALTDEGLDDSFDAMKIPDRMGPLKVDADAHTMKHRTATRADMFRFIAFASDTGKPCGHGKTRNAAFSDGKRNHPLRGNDHYEVLEFDMNYNDGEQVWDNRISFNRAYRCALIDPDAEPPSLRKPTRQRTIVSAIKG